VGWLMRLLSPYSETSPPVAVEPPAPPQAVGPPPLGVVVGVSRGVLAAKGHENGIGFGSPVVMHEKDLHKNLLVCGETGTGKTSRVLLPAVAQLCHFGAGGLVIDTTKGGSLTSKIQRIAEEAGRRVVVFGWCDDAVPDSRPWNPLTGQTVQVLASRMRALLTRRGAPSGDRSTWINSGVDTATAIFGLLSVFRDGSELSLKNASRFLRNWSCMHLQRRP
jgi:hypothetical protein